MRKSIICKTLLVSIFIFIMNLTSAYAVNSSFLETDNGQNSYNLSSYSLFLLDETASLGLDDILSGEVQKRFKPSGRKSLNFGVVPDYACWVKFTIFNPSPKDQEFVLELGTATINSAALYVPNHQGKYIEKTAGDMHPLSTRDYFHRHSNFAIQLGSGEMKTVYLRLKTEAILESSLHLHTKKAFIDRLPVEYMLLGFFYAAFLVAIIYNLFLYLSLRDVNYLLYVLYASSFLCIWLFIDGLGQQFFWPYQPWQQVWGTRIANTVTCFFMVLFASSFFNCRKNAPRLFKIFIAIAALCFFNTIMVSIFPLAEYKAPVRIAWLLAIPAIIFTAALFFKRGFKRARYFLVAWLFVLAGAAVFFLEMYLGVFANSFLTRYSWRIASVFEIILLSLALADRINELNEQKEEALDLALAAETRLKEGLEEQVDMRTSELRKALAEVKTLGGMLPICASCKKIRDDEGYWNQIESYIEEHSDAEFTHGLCPDCLEKMYGADEWYIKLKNKNENG